MNNMDFFDAIGWIDEQYVLEAKEYKTKRNRKKLIYAGGIAACFALCIFLGRAVHFQTANRNDPAVPEKQSATEREESATDHISIQKSDREEATTSAAMDQLNQYFSEHDFPDWFGDYYLEGNMVYVSLVEFNEDNKSQVQTWAKSTDIIFKKAEFSYNYLNSVINRVSHSIENKEIDFINGIWIDSKWNRIKVNLNREITEEEKETLYSYDGKSKGEVFDVEHQAEAPEADVDTQNQVNPNIKSVKMETKINKKHMLQVKMQNLGGEKISFGSQYQLYQRHKEGWYEVVCLPDVGFQDMEYYLKENETYRDKVDLEQIFGKLEAGQYKIEKEVQLQESRILVSSEFEI